MEINKNKKRMLTPRETNFLSARGIDPYSDEVQSSGDKPVEYIAGVAEFRGVDFIVDKYVLIPRIETEKLIDIALDQLRITNYEFQIESTKEKLESDEKSISHIPYLTSHISVPKTNIEQLTTNKANGSPSGQQLVFCDVGTGSGCIGISFASELYKRDIPFNGILSDVSNNALKVAKRNAFQISNSKDAQSSKETHISYPISHLSYLQSDLLSNYPKEVQFDIIFANLPYIPSTRIKTLQTSVKNYEPQNALDGGTDGLLYIRKLLDQALDHLKDDGVVILEVDDTHDEVKSYKLQVTGWKIDVTRDENEKVRYWVCKKVEGKESRV